MFRETCVALLAMSLGALAPSAGAPAAHHQDASPEAAELQRIVGTRVSLAIPSGYSISSSFTGLMDARSGASIMITELTGPYEEIVRGFVEPGVLRSQGMKLLKREKLSMGEHDGILAELEQIYQGGTYRKWSRVAGTDSACVIIMATCPAEQVENEAERLRSAVLSARWDPDLVLDPLAGLAYRIGDPGTLEFFDRTRNAITYSADGEGDEAREGKPMFLCSPGVRPPIGDDRQKFAERLLKRTATFKRVKQESIEAIQIDSLPGFVCIGTAEGATNDLESFIYQVVLFEGDSYWELKGFGAAEHRETYLPMFARMAASFERRWETVTAANGLSEIQVPATWGLRQGINEEADLQAGHSVGSVFLIVLTEPKSDFDEGFSFHAHSRLTREWLDQDASESSEPRKVTINGRRALRCEYEVPAEGMDLSYVHISVDGEEHFHQLLFWCYSSTRDACEADMERVLGSFREVKGEGR